MSPRDPGPALTLDLLGEPARLAEPGALALLGAVAALVLLGAFAIARRRAALERAAGPLAARVAPGATAGGPAARLGLGAAGLALLAVALARPQCGTRLEEQRRYGADLVVVLDVSRSMRARDVKPDRLERARLEVGALVDGLGGDRVGLVAFAGTAFVACPLTTDHAAARLFLRGLAPEAFPQQGTALADALRAAREVLEAADHGARSKVVLLVTDGEDHRGGAEEVAGALADAGIRVFALAVGGRAGAPIPLVNAAGEVTGYKRDRAGALVSTRLDEAGLQALAARGGGKVFDVEAPGGGVEAFLAELARMERSELTGRTAVVWEERYARVAYPAFLLLLGALLWPEARRPRAAAPPAGRERP